MRSVGPGLLVAALAVVAAACPRTADPGGVEMTTAVFAWPEDWAEALGRTVTVEGTAQNAKLGALLAGDGQSVWIDGLAAWPEGFYLGGNRGKRLRVTGKVIDRRDLPVFVPAEGEPARAGMPVPAGTDLDQASVRYLLSEASWVVID